MKSNRSFLTVRTAPAIFLTPFLLFFIVFMVGPVLWSLGVSFVAWDGFSAARFVGLRNYLTLFSTQRFWTAILNTLFFVVIYNAIMISLSILLATIASNPDIAGRRFFRTVFFIPIATSLVVCAIIFDRVLAKDFGFVNLIIKVFGGKGDTPFISSGDWIKWSIVAMRVWRGTGYYSAFIIAGLTSIPLSLYEAADMDGAGSMVKFVRITLPSLRPVILFCLTMSVILTFQIFDEPWVLNQGGPADASLTLQILLYQFSFAYNKIGVGSALAYVMTLLMIAVSLVNSAVMEKGQR